jgi:glycosyltransferase involved in cell wall biosynthesis
VDKLVHVIEPTLTDETGHCYSFIKSLCIAAPDMQFRLWIARTSNVCFPSVNVCIERLFHRKLRRVQALLLYRRLLDDAACILIATAGRTDLLLLDLLQRDIPANKVYLYFHWFRDSVERRLYLKKIALRYPNLQILGPTQTITSIFSECGFQHVLVAPYPITPVSREDTSQVYPFRHLLFAGAARKDKGFHHLKDFIVYCAGNKLEIPITIQTSAAHYDKYDNETLRALDEIRSTHYNHLVEITETLLQPDYLNLFPGAICIQLYDRTDFADRISGITLDALSHGSPVITLAGTWIAGIVKRFDAGIILEEPDVNLLFAAVRRVIDSYDDYRERAYEAGKMLQTENSAGHLIQILTGLSEQEINIDIAAQNKALLTVTKTTECDPALSPAGNTSRENIRLSKISAYIIAYNEERNIGDAIRSVQWADEIVVVDSFSSDRTVEIATELGARVVQVAFEGFGKLRNSAIAATRFEWVFSLDTDERCTGEARDEMLRLAELPGAKDAYYTPRRNSFMGQRIKHCGWYPDYRQPQFFRRTALVFKDDMVHEGYSVHGDIGYMKNYIHQEPYRDLSQMCCKLERYASLGADKLKQRGKSATMWKALSHGVAAFARIYLVKGGILDGWPGFVIALANFEYTFYKYAKRAEQTRLEESAKSN